MKTPHNIAKYALFFLTSLALASCVAPSTVYRSSTALTPPLQSSVLILPPDVVISSRTAGGTVEPRADWSEAVVSQLNLGLQDYFYSRGVEFIPYGSDTYRDEHIDIVRQNNVILDAVEFSQYGGGIDGQREYSIGREDAEALSQTDADYALYIVLRANRATGGRQAVAVLAAIGGISVSTSDSSFRVGLFDLRDGQLSWANFDPAALADIGDPVNADAQDWEKAVDHLLRDFPL